MALYHAISLFRQGKKRRGSRRPRPRLSRFSRTSGTRWPVWMAYKEAKGLIKFEANLPPRAPPKSELTV
jgi:hypothetical protein